MLGLPRIGRNVRSARRFRTIITALVRYGFGQLVEELDLNAYLELGQRLFRSKSDREKMVRLTAPQRLRLVLEELGPTFIKLGQILSTRPDLLPEDYINQLSKLQDLAPSVPFREIRREIEDEFETTLGDIFSRIDETPLAAASIAQVHRATLKDGSSVAVKVRRPGIRRIIETDLDILNTLAQLIDKHLPSLAIYDPCGIAREFRQTLTREMDFRREGMTIERFAENFKGDETVMVPQVHWDYTCARVLVLDYVDGIKVSDLDKLTALGYDLKQIARNGSNALIRQVLEFGLFHADPHPGNIFILPGHRICFVDYGMVGHLLEEQKNQLLDLLDAIVEKDPEPIISMLVYSGDLSDEVNLKNLKRDISDFIEHFYELPLQQIHVGQLMFQFLELQSRYRIRFPVDLTLLAKSLVTIEGLGRRLDPDFDMVARLKPFVEELIRERLSPITLSKEMFRTAKNYGALLRNLPKDLREFMNRVNHNKFKMALEHRGLEKLISEFDKSSNRISFSLVISALIIGSSLIMLIERGPQLFGFPILGLLGYSIAGVLGLWLAIGILRSGRL